MFFSGIYIAPPIKNCLERDDDKAYYTIDFRSCQNKGMAQIIPKRAPPSKKPRPHPSTPLRFAQDDVAEALATAQPFDAPLACSG